MHIPDGYLSPSTCLTFYAASIPFWHLAFRRVKEKLNTQLIPSISLFAAFSFVLMMFNIPLPGGTSGHGVGMALAAITIGPWASILSISVALLIQALFFGDGGITTFGANCFNLAIVGPFVAYFIFKLIAGRTALLSTGKRRIIAAGIAGYISINVAALFAAIEFGIQPAFFKDVTGAPLYAPFPIHISIPAMMIGHLTFAGLAEMLITVGVVTYLQRTSPQRSSSMEARHASLVPAGANYSRVKPRMWVFLAVIILITPLGLLTSQTSWGEWAAADFVDGKVISYSVASSAQRPMDKAPTGLEKLQLLWKAPLKSYFLPFIESASIGYILSAIIGVGLILLTFLVVRKSLRSTGS
ncbi:MAG: cobalt transporter CbiM [Pyrinomonadaceae bacterium]